MCQLLAVAANTTFPFSLSSLKPRSSEAFAGRLIHTSCSAIQSQTCTGIQHTNTTHDTFLNHPYVKAQQCLTLYPYQYKLLNPLRKSRKQLRNFCYQQSAAARHILIFTDTTFLIPALFSSFSRMFPLASVVSIFLLLWF